MSFNSNLTLLGSSYLLSSNGSNDSTPNGGSEKDSSWPVVAGLFAFIALFLSIWEIIQHAMNFNKPFLQKFIVRILWMVPIYAMDSWLAMNFPSFAIYLDTLRECYEAFVIYSFMKYLLNFLTYEMNIEEILDFKPPVYHLWPWYHVLNPIPGGRRFLNRCKHGILQYTVIRPVTTFLALFTQSIGVYGEEHRYNFKFAYPYLLVINNLSQMLAMYCLVIFYTAFKSELKPMKPLGKFLCIKAVVFFSFFQGVLISLLIEIGIITQAFIPSGLEWNNSDIARNLQDFLICFEMLLAAMVHLVVFSHKPFIDLAAVNDPCCYSFMRIVDISDERMDLNDHFRQIGRRWREFWNRNRNENSYDRDIHENSPLIPMQARNSDPKRYNSSDFVPL